MSIDHTCVRVCVCVTIWFMIFYYNKNQIYFIFYTQFYIVYVYDFISLWNTQNHSNNRLCSLVLLFTCCVFHNFYIVDKLELKCVMNCSTKALKHTQTIERTRNNFKDFRFIRLIIWGIRNETKWKKKNINRSFQGKTYVTLYSIYKFTFLALVKSISSSLCAALSFCRELCARFIGFSNGWNE